MASGRVATNNFAVPDFIVDTNGLQNGATHTTIQGAIDDASSGDTIAVRPGTYTENITTIANISITGFPGQAPAGNVVLMGQIDVSAGTCTIANLIIRSNGSAIVTDTGAVTNQSHLTDCTFFLDDADCISVNNASSSISFIDCEFRQTADSLDLYNITTCTTITFSGCDMTMSASTPGVSDIAAGTARFRYSRIQPHRFTTSSSGKMEGEYSQFLNILNNVTPITTAGTGSSYFDYCNFASGTAVAISVGSGTTVTLPNANIQSSNSNPLTGAGTVVYGSVTFEGTGQGENVTTHTRRPLAVGSISFDGNTNKMQNYEEGTFTPTVIGSSTPGTASYSVQVGNYTRIGREVNFRIALVWTGGTGTGNLQITGLPFTVNTNNGNCAVAMNFSSTLTVSSGYDQVNAFLGANTTNVNFNEIDFNTASGNVAYDAAATITLSGCYYV